MSRPEVLVSDLRSHGSRTSFADRGDVLIADRLAGVGTRGAEIFTRLAGGAVLAGICLAVQNSVELPGESMRPQTAELTEPRLIATNSQMRHLASFVAVLLATLWLPATLRCELEVIPGLESLGCKTPCSDHAGKGCPDGCAALEAGFAKLANDLVKIPLPVQSFFDGHSALLINAALLPPARKIDRGWRADGEEDSRRRTWHFVRRAAPPSRAPSA